ncbi:hypothetical protein AGOR_G00227040 [Albula goreensis]|uniref:Uncharacterized protein n=1 Tax=Albula goreensis TaxID=1534307 RepID=A0A8T3CLV7_9TELE|nr:hypothetical protein AGOR_G00227040 [Albula goreensis]
MGNGLSKRNIESQLCREKLERLAGEYISETLSCIDTVKEFSDGRIAWLLQRKKEVNKMKNIIDRAERSKVTTAHITKSQNKLKAMDEYLDSKFTQVNPEELERELRSVLQDTLVGLKKMTPFLEAVEKLAVISLSVFREGNPLCQLPRGTSAADVCAVISAAMRTCPLLIHFQRNNSKFFLPSLANADVLALQLEKYVEVTKDLCERLQESISSFGMISRTNKIYIKENLSRKTIQTMYDHLNQLTDIRLSSNLAPLEAEGVFTVSRCQKVSECIKLTREKKEERIKKNTSRSSLHLASLFRVGRYSENSLAATDLPSLQKS